MVEADFREIFDASPNAYMLLDREFRFVAANPAYLRATGATLEGLIGRNLFDAFPHDPDDPNNQNAYRQLIGHRAVVGLRVRDAIPEVEGQGFLQVLDRVFASGEPFVGRGMGIRLQRHPGAGLEEVFVDFVFQPILDPSGAVTGIFVQGHDITAQKALEAEREALLEQQRYLTEAIPQLVWTADAQGELTSVNTRVLEYVGTAEDQVLGSRWLQFVHPDDADRAVARWLESIRTEREYDAEFRLRRADGAYRWHLSRAVAMHRASGVVSRWFGTSTDIDDSKRARDELLARSAYEQQLIGIVSHDLRNPINVISIAAGVLEKTGPLTEPQARAVARIASSADRARRMIRDFLDFTRARSAGRIPVTPVPASIRQIAQQVFDEVRVLHPERAARIEHTGDDRGRWDGDRIAQVIANLLSNAFQHSAPAATIELRTSGTPEQVAVEIRNQGIPIPPGDLARLFEPFERGAQAPSAERSVGLGLFTSKQIVAAHHGTIEVRSTAEEGTVFTVRLPRDPSGGT